MTKHQGRTLIKMEVTDKQVLEYLITQYDKINDRTKIHTKQIKELTKQIKELQK